MTLPFRNIPKNNLRNTLSLTIFTFYRRLEKKISFSKRENFLFKTHASLLQSTDKMREILYFQRTR